MERQDGLTLKKRAVFTDIPSFMIMQKTIMVFPYSKFEYFYNLWNLNKEYRNNVKHYLFEAYNYIMNEIGTDNIYKFLFNKRLYMIDKFKLLAFMYNTPELREILKEKGSKKKTFLSKKYVEDYINSTGNLAQNKWKFILKNLEPWVEFSYLYRRLNIETDLNDKSDRSRWIISLFSVSCISINFLSSSTFERSSQNDINNKIKELWNIIIKNQEDYDVFCIIFFVFSNRLNFNINNDNINELPGFLNHYIFMFNIHLDIFKKPLIEMNLIKNEYHNFKDSLKNKIRLNDKGVINKELFEYIKIMMKSFKKHYSRDINFIDLFEYSHKFFNISKVLYKFDTFKNGFGNAEYPWIVLSYAMVLSPMISGSIKNGTISLIDYKEIIIQFNKAIINNMKDRWLKNRDGDELLILTFTQFKLEYRKKYREIFNMLIFGNEEEKNYFYNFYLGKTSLGFFVFDDIISKKKLKNLFL